ncbi:Mesaconyl-CoA hydratase [Minicystis rosea]|nr:Mesaconyl-CoA hydratase [Minicystis rosea]
MILEPRYGRLLDDFVPGDVYDHPWEVTVDEGMLSHHAASFQCALPTYNSRAAARALGLRDRPAHPLLLLNLGLSFSVHDVSERAIAHLAYIDARFPNACYAGDTVRASSRVIAVKPVSSGDKGVVHVRTHLVTDAGALVCSFERKALVRAGKVNDRPADPPHDLTQDDAEPARLPPELRGELPAPVRRGGFAFFWDDLEVGDVIAHPTGRTVTEAEHVQLTTLYRNSHPLHTDEHYCRQHSFAKTRVVYGGLVLSWVLSLTSRDTAGNAIWDLGLDDGAHPSGVLAGDTLFAASKVIAKEPRGPHAGAVTLRIVGLKNTPARPLLDRGLDLFSPELGKTSGKVNEKVVEITRTLLVRRRDAARGGS